MRLGAAHRLLAADKTQELRTFIASLSEQERDYILTGLPMHLGWGWFGQSFKRKLMTPKIVLEGATEVTAEYGADEYKKFITGMIQIRRIFPPHTTGGEIHRLTATKEKPEGDTVIFKNEEQYRSLTSWTTLPKPVVVDRTRPKKTVDIILGYELPSAKNVLFDYQSAADYVNTLSADRDFYMESMNKINQTMFKNTLLTAKKELDSYVKEKEVALYLNAGQELECTWRPA
jgi:hypothetical protein